MTLTTDHIANGDDLRHRVPAGTKTRDSLFWNIVLPEHQVAVQIYIWTDGDGVAGRQVAVYFPDPARSKILNAFQVDLGPDMDLDDWLCAGLGVRHTESLRCSALSFAEDGVELDYRFTATHRPFSYRENPAGCPAWLATNRFEQTGRATGVLRVHGLEIPFADVWTHRDHSWGRRNWGQVQHWKWLVAGLPDGPAVNAMFHVARGEPGINGYLLRSGEPVPIVDGRAHAEYDADMAQVRLEADLIDARGGRTRLEMERYAIFHVPFGSDNLLSEAACRAWIDGEAVPGQFETLWPASQLRRMVEET